jgi:hypothetical protein
MLACTARALVNQLVAFDAGGEGQSLLSVSKLGAAVLERLGLSSVRDLSSVAVHAGRLNRQLRDTKGHNRFEHMLRHAEKTSRVQTPGSHLIVVFRAPQQHVVGWWFGTRIQ